ANVVNSFSIFEKVTYFLFGRFPAQNLEIGRFRDLRYEFPYKGMVVRIPGNRWQYALEFLWRHRRDLSNIHDY
ncbi:hypothetical protein SCLCIDRAFT_788029, partial [Scleroderma citrinum Foug A]